jgi:hypothetical protein
LCNVTLHCNITGILTIGYSPLGVPDNHNYPLPMSPTLLVDPVVVKIATRVGVLPAQVIQRFEFQVGSRLVYLKQSFYSFVYVFLFGCVERVARAGYPALRIPGRFNHTRFNLFSFLVSPLCLPFSYTSTNCNSSFLRFAFLPVGCDCQPAIDAISAHAREHVVLPRRRRQGFCRRHVCGKRRVAH